MSNRTDTFDRANASLSGSTPSDGGSAWSVYSGTWQIISNQASEQTGSNDLTCVLDCGSADADVQVTVAVWNGKNGVCGRASDSTHFLFFAYDNVGNVQLWKNNGGAFTQLGSNVAYTTNAGDVFKLSMSGNTLNCYINGVLKIGPITEAFNNTVTSHGLYTSAGGVLDRYDDFSISTGAVATAVIHELGPSGVSGSSRWELKP